MPRVLGLDPGSYRTGWGVVEGVGGQNYTRVASGVIAASGELAARLATISHELKSIVERYRPIALAVESSFVGPSPRSGLILGQAKGAALAVASLAGLEVYEFAPRSVKKALTGSGSSGKSQVAYMVRAILAMPKPAAEDESDALAVAVYHLQSLGTSARLSETGQGGPP